MDSRDLGVKVAVATTMAAYVTDQSDTCLAWLYTAEALRESAEEAGCEVDYFAALEVDARGLQPFEAVLERLSELGGTYWTFSLDDGTLVKTTASRLRFLTLGENLASDYATSTGATHMLFVAADCCPPPDVLPKLLEVNHPVVGAECPTYCLHGPSVVGYPFPVQEQLASAACILLERSIFKQLKWRHDPDLGLTDDPALQHDVRELLGIPVLVRKDVVARHYPEAVPPIEARGHDMRVFR